MRSLSLYEGRLRVEFDEASHVYLVNGERWPSVTSAGDAYDGGKSGALLWWGVNEMWDALEPKIGQLLTRDDLCDARCAHQRKKEEAAGLGKAIHDYLDAHLKAKMEFADEPTLPEDPRVRLAVETLLRVEGEQRIIYFASEQMVASMQHRIIGTLDRRMLIASAGGVPCLKDFKSGAIRVSHRLQQAAYCCFWNEEHPTEPIWKRLVDKLPTDDSQEYVSFDLCYPGMSDEESTRLDYEAFLHCIALNRWGKLAAECMPEDKRVKKDRKKAKKKGAKA